MYAPTFVDPSYNLLIVIQGLIGFLVQLSVPHFVSSLRAALIWTRFYARRLYISKHSFATFQGSNNDTIIL
jgi:hypothetical protein